MGTPPYLVNKQFVSSAAVVSIKCTHRQCISDNSRLFIQILHEQGRLLLFLQDLRSLYIWQYIESPRQVHAHLTHTYIDRSIAIFVVEKCRKLLNFIKRHLCL